MSSLNFIGGEKGGVGKSVVARVLAQYFIDHGRAFTGFDTDRSHTSFLRFYADFASPVVVDSYAGLDRVVEAFDVEADAAAAPSVIVDLAAQTSAPLGRWIADSDLVALMGEMGVAVNFWHVADGGADSVALLDRLIETYGAGPNYIVVKNFGRGGDFSYMDGSEPMRKAVGLGARVINLPALHESSMLKIDRQNASFWAAGNNREGAEALGLLERQRVKTWLRSAYLAFDALAL
jgi:hypothetical protein